MGWFEAKFVSYAFIADVLLKTTTFVLEPGRRRKDPAKNVWGDGGVGVCRPAEKDIAQVTDEGIVHR